MNIYVKINDLLYPAEITGRLYDGEWDNRASKYIKCQMSYQEALSLWVDDASWSIVQVWEETEYQKSDDEESVITVPVTVEKVEEIDNSEYSIAGDIIDHRNGYITIKMGKPTAEELLKMLEEALL